MRAAVDARRRAGLEPPDAQRSSRSFVASVFDGGSPAPALGVEADVDLAAQEGADGQHHAGA
jgi:high-affinity K+ transport system ATPase subunit B